MAFIATAEALDAEMAARVQAHQHERGADFTTIEEPLELETALLDASRGFRSIVVDCLTLWLSNLMFAEPARDIARQTSSMLRVAAESEASVFLVTNEVGCGIVPENELARRFRDHAGVMNQQAAAVAGEAYWMVFGQPLRVK